MTITSIVKKFFKGFEYTLGNMATRVVDTTQTKLPGRPEIANALETVNAARASLNEALARVRKNAHTTEIEKANEQRGSLFHALVMRLESDILWFFDPKIQQNAIKLYTIIEQQIGKTLKKALSEQSQQIEILFSRFDSMKTTIDENGYTPLYDNLKTLDTQLKNAVALSTESVAVKKEIPWLSVASDELIDSLNEDLFTRLKVHSEDNADKEPFIEVVNILNKIIDEAHKIQRARIARGETEDTPPADNADDKPAQLEEATA